MCRPRKMNWMTFDPFVRCYRQVVSPAVFDMTKIPDIIIALGVIVGALGLSTGFRKIGVISMLIAIIVGWKRNWCIGLMEELLQSSEHNSTHDTGSSDTAPDVCSDDAGGDHGGDAHSG